MAKVGRELGIPLITQEREAMEIGPLKYSAKEIGLFEYSSEEREPLKNLAEESGVLEYSSEEVDC